MTCRNPNYQYPITIEIRLTKTQPLSHVMLCSLCRGFGWLAEIPITSQILSDFSVISVKEPVIFYLTIETLLNYQLSVKSSTPAMTASKPNEGNVGSLVDVKPALRRDFTIRGVIEGEEQKDQLSFFSLIPQIDAALVNGSRSQKM